MLGSQKAASPDRSPRDLDLALGFNVWMSSNARSCIYRTGGLPTAVALLPDAVASGMDSIRLIDVVWMKFPDSFELAACSRKQTSVSGYRSLRRSDTLLLRARTSSGREKRHVVQRLPRLPGGQPPK